MRWQTGMALAPDGSVESRPGSRRPERARGSVELVVTATLGQWKQAKFSAAELADPDVSGEEADPDGDGIGNELEYLLGFEPMTADPLTARPRAAVEGGYFTLTFSRYRLAADRTLVVEFSPDLLQWSAAPPAVEPVSAIDLGLTEQVTVRAGTPVNATGQGFLRLKSL